MLSLCGSDGPSTCELSSPTSNTSHAFVTAFGHLKQCSFYDGHVCVPHCTFDPSLIRPQRFVVLLDVQFLGLPLCVSVHLTSIENQCGLRNTEETTKHVFTKLLNSKRVHWSVVLLCFVPAVAAARIWTAAKRVRGHFVTALQDADPGIGRL